jgi:hypothetical protein
MTVTGARQRVSNPDQSWSQETATLCRSRGKPSGAKAMGLCLGAACKLSLGSKRSGKMRIARQAPKTTLKLIVYVPSLLQARPPIS